MASSLNSIIVSLAETFADELLATISRVSLSDIFGDAAAPSVTPAGVHRSSAAVAKTRASGVSRAGKPANVDVSAIVDVLRAYPNGLRAERLRAELGLGRDAMQKSVAIALESGAIGKRGARRGTMYFVA